MKAETGLFGHNAYFKVMRKKVHPFKLPSPFPTPASRAVFTSLTFAMLLLATGLCMPLSFCSISSEHPSLPSSPLAYSSVLGLSVTS